MSVLWLASSTKLEEQEDEQIGCLTNFHDSLQQCILRTLNVLVATETLIENRYVLVTVFYVNIIL